MNGPKLREIVPVRNTFKIGHEAAGSRVIHPRMMLVCLVLAIILTLGGQAIAAELIGSGDCRVELPDAPAGTFVTTEAYLLIPCTTSKRIESSIHLVPATRPFAPMAVPQTGLPM